MVTQPFQPTELHAKPIPQPLPEAFIYHPALDGLRALAVSAVLIYHARANWLPGGFLGVDVFFVISGYLITTLLLAEWERNGRIAIARFWLRRARRLLPALCLLLLGVSLGALLLAPGHVAQLRPALLAALTYSTNWYLIFDQQPYFMTVGAPSPLLHLWSLAIEEQFYLIWPLAVAAALSRSGRRGLLIMTIAGATLFSLLLVMLYNPGADSSRIYYGTDTRAAALLAGAALACAWPPERRNRAILIMPKPLDALVGWFALAALGLCMWRLNEYTPALYRGGFAVVALLSVMMIVASFAASSYRRLLVWPPLRWIGLRSSSLYLWHWPIFLALAPGPTLPPDSPRLLILRLLVTFLLAECSYRFVELPMRSGLLVAAWERWRAARQTRRGRLGWLTMSGSAALCIALLAHLLLTAPAPAAPIYLQTRSVPTAALLANASAPLDGTSFALAAARWRAPTPTRPATPTATPPPTATPVLGHVVAIGDSVMLGAADQLHAMVGDIDVDAAVSRHASGVVDIVRARHANGPLGDAVVIQTGNNGPLSVEEFDAIMHELNDVRRVVVVNLRVPRGWEVPNNSVIAEGVQRYPNAVLIDWYGASADRWDLLWDDGIHLRPEGQQLYAQLVNAALHK